ncbi:biotin transporter BioY [Galactobacter valiniphilus]|uniref:Biotin transporter n=1 Tax=Galactobacter valiniphilus TaxID=2676122 RepID=A0A399J994_9MICC|nr:biotin transporter BioY [Galactobacter valiniphilus]RII42143.1 biotin transporter BioY [Galactobacter valiniphilus]
MTASTPTAAGATLPRTLSLVVVFAALIAALTMAPAIPVGPLGVPITLQTLGVALTALVLGAKRGGLAVLLYVVLGLAGLPIFARFSGGLGALAAPSAGYLLAFPVAALVTGALATLVLRRSLRAKGLWLFGCALAGSFLVTHPAGILGMMINGHLSLQAAFLADLAYWPGDLVKSALAAALAVGILKAFPALAARNPSGL